MGYNKLRQKYFDALITIRLYEVLMSENKPQVNRESNGQLVSLAFRGRPIAVNELLLILKFLVQLELKAIV